MSFWKEKKSTNLKKKFLKKNFNENIPNKIFFKQFLGTLKKFIGEGEIYKDNNITKD